jgi:hypothetical protein
MRGTTSGTRCVIRFHFRRREAKQREKKRHRAIVIRWRSLRRRFATGPAIGPSTDVREHGRSNRDWNVCRKIGSRSNAHGIGGEKYRRGRSNRATVVSRSPAKIAFDKANARQNPPAISLRPSSSRASTIVEIVAISGGGFSVKRALSNTALRAEEPRYASPCPRGETRSLRLLAREIILREHMIPYVLTLIKALRVMENARPCVPSSSRHLTSPSLLPLLVSLFIRKS